MTYSYSNKNRFNYLELPLIKTLTINILLPFLVWYFYQWPLRYFFELFLLIFIAFAILEYFPVILLNKNYLKKSKNIKLDYDEFNKEYTFKDNTRELHFKTKEIVKIDSYMYKPLCEGGPILLSWYNYFYVKIYTEKDEIIVTCLTCSNILDILPEEKINKKCIVLNNLIKI
ncbi:hypothetical protein [Lutimonas zeaxanthinifaciens]|uniref:hypothetical protein n=1 Tax=Lutimonas zeaxanthinifaciens TaxID=3060215 RepID=UPI00265D3DEC|nr:hypothetical protein [Lutimonas sp. YSD2104]WKK67017.1 hypothetical protein QZH61_05190 [Lutimonas sp. YSD2104]